MTRYCLDTSVLIDFSKAREPTLSWVLFQVRGTDELGICCVSVAEFYSGISEPDRSIWDPFFESLLYWDVSRGAAMLAGRDRHMLARQGQSISTTDALIGATARELGAVLVTENVSDFPMPDMRLLSLRSRD